MKDIDDIIQETSTRTITNYFLKKFGDFHISIDIEREAAIKFDKLKMVNTQSFSFLTQLEHLGAVITKLAGRCFVLGDSNPCALDDPEGWKKKFSAWN
ncbi:uncharacterized protein EAE97_004608 [Botrytis byssoidea]|uniref:Uncharacterized protein n=1 Tax=Botrytis byssoidea TaxID=139641 RepID=A0A9P5M7R9_9HELO|nr:uncharacterized protein EAE97_004608 [Botrytis byssoidea]KAF7947359.1 hypothetical protein EAE97_004608 [Botrytis byssoidea]